MNEILEAVLQLIKAATSLSCSIGSLPAGEGIVISDSTGREDGTFLDKQKIYETSIEIIGKSKNSETLNESMWAIHSALTQRTNYPHDSSGTWAILDIESRATPFYSFREQNSYKVMASSVSVRWHLA